MKLPVTESFMVIQEIPDLPDSTAEFLEKSIIIQAMLMDGTNPFGPPEKSVMAAGKELVPSKMETGDWRAYPGLQNLYYMRFWMSYPLVQLAVLVQALALHREKPLPSNVLSYLRPLMANQPEAINRWFFTEFQKH